MERTFVYEKQERSTDRDLKVNVFFFHILFEIIMKIGNHNRAFFLVK